MIEKKNFDNLCKYIKNHYFEIVNNDKTIKAIWNQAGKYNIFNSDLRKDSLYILDTLSKYGIYDFPFWLQRDVLIPLFEKNASQEQRAKYLQRMKSGELICALAITEETGGSSFDNITSRVRFSNEEYIISCKKNVVTNACFADIFFLVTKDNNNDLCVFLIEKENSQLFINKTNTIPYINGLGIGEIICDSLKLPPISKLGDGGSIKISLPYSLAIERFCCASLVINICYEMYEDIVEWTKKRDINSIYQTIWFKLSEFYTNLLEIKTFYNFVKCEFVKNHNLFYLAAELKYSTVNLALNLSSSIARICGCNAIDKKSPINTVRYLNLSLAYAAAGGTQEVMLQIVSHFILNHL